MVACNTHYHDDILIKLFNQRFPGKILVEKPLTADPGKLENLSFGPDQVMINYCRRYHLPYQRIKKYYKNNKDSIKSVFISCGCAGYFMLISHYLDVISFITEDFTIYPTYSDLINLDYENVRGPQFQDFAGTIIFNSKKSNLRIFIDCSNDLGTPPFIRFQGGCEVIEFSEIDGSLIFYKRNSDVINEPLNRYNYPLNKVEQNIYKLEIPLLLEMAYQDLLGSFSIGCNWEQGLINANVLLRALPSEKRKDLILA